ncbi:MAG: hypothetical protein WCL34_12410 [Methylococcaceae bacterium]
MAIIDLFSKRQKRLRGEYPDVYVYDELPRAFRVQVIHIIKGAIGSSCNSNKIYQVIHDILCQEYGEFRLSDDRFCSIDESILNEFFLNEKSVEKCLDVIEIAFRLIDRIIGDGFKNYNQEYVKDEYKITILPNEAISDLNTRFKEHGIGFQFESSEIICVDSEFIHSEVVKPTLLILRGEQYAGANDEFLNAHEHYRHGLYKECLNDCLKSFESTMRVICNSRGWSVPSNATASKLITTCFDNGLLQPFFDSQINSVKSLLESGVPTIRNKLGGHGQGESPVVVSEHLARYALHLTATTILLLAEADANTTVENN